MSKLIKKIKIETNIEALTGLHIGGGNESVEIGGIDTPVIKLGSKGNQPYIPGSSIKGKMRCLLEQEAGIAVIGVDEQKGNGPINDLFGITEIKEKIDVNKPSKLIVRDAMLTEASEKELRENDNTDMPYTEGKTENTIDRITAKANPRTIERVPAGAIFKAEFIINVWGDGNEEKDEEEEKRLLNLFKKGLKLLQNDYLGGNGSRGYGQIEFGELKRTDFCAGNNWDGEIKDSIELN